MGSPTIFSGKRTKVLTANGLLLQSGATIDNDGSKNYIPYGNIESGISKFSLGTIGTLVNGLPTGSPTFGSGANAALSITTVTSGQLAGTQSLSLVSSAATTAGDMLASSAIAIDLEDQAKVLSFKFYYKSVVGSPNLSGTSANSFAVAVYDVTNSSFIPVAGAFNLVQGSGVGIAQGSFQTNATTASIRFIVYNASATPAAATMYFDDFFVGPQSLAFGPAVSDWVQYTPTFTGFGAPTNVSFVSRRVGDSLEVVGSFTAGTTTAVEAQISLGYNGASGNVTSDNTKTTNTIQIAGMGIYSANAASTPYALIEPSKSYLTFGFQDSTHAGFTKVVGNLLLSTGGTFGFFAKVPIAGWSSNTVMSSDSDTKIVASSYTGLGGVTSYTAGQIVKYVTQVFDTSGSYNPSTGLYTCSISGFFRITNGFNTSTAGNVWTYVGKNNSTELYRLAFSAASFADGHGSVIVKCNSGDTLGVYASSTMNMADGPSYAYVMFEKLAGPAVVAASESVNASYSASGVIAWTATGGANFDVKNYDSHNAVTTGANAWTFVAPSSGKYSVTLTMTISAAATALALFKNGILYKYFFRCVNASGFIGNGTVDVPLVAGDYIDVRFDSGSGNGDSSPNANNIYIKRVGN